MAQQMQLLDIADDTKFLTQTVSEQRVHDIMKEAKAQNEKRGKRKLKDAKTLHRNICFAELRRAAGDGEEPSQAVVDEALRPQQVLGIHVVVAPCCVFSPSVDTSLKAVDETEGALAALTVDTWYLSVLAGLTCRALL